MLRRNFLSGFTILTGVWPDNQRFSFFNQKPGRKVSIVNPITKEFGFMKHHASGVGHGVPDQLTYFLDDQLFPAGRLFVAYRRVKNADDAPAHVTQHYHTVPQTYIWIGDKADLSGLTVELVLGDEQEKVLIESPKTVVIPPKTLHSHRYVEGSGHFLGIVETNGKSYNDVTV